jgi:hypothetical protein
MDRSIIAPRVRPRNVEPPYRKMLAGDASTGPLGAPEVGASMQPPSSRSNRSLSADPLNRANRDPAQAGARFWPERPVWRIGFGPGSPRSASAPWAWRGAAKSASLPFLQSQGGGHQKAFGHTREAAVEIVKPAACTIKAGARRC